MKVEVLRDETDRELAKLAQALRLMMAEHVAEVERNDPTRGEIRAGQWPQMKQTAADIAALEVIRRICLGGAMDYETIPEALGERGCWRAAIGIACVLLLAPFFLLFTLFVAGTRRAARWWVRAMDDVTKWF